MNKVLNFMSKHTALVYGVIAVCVICIFLFPYGKRLYNQFPTYKWDIKHMGNIENEEAFGAKYIDEYLHETWHGKIYVENAEDALKKYRKKKANFLYINEYENDSAATANIISRANNGSRFLYATTDDYFIENLNIYALEESPSFDIKDFLRNPREQKRETLYLRNGAKSSTIKMWNTMIGYEMSAADTIRSKSDLHYDCYNGIPRGTYTSLISRKSGYDIAARRDIGKGCITLVYSFAFFTNYAASDEDMRKGMEHVMNATFDKRLPLVIVYREETDYAKGMNGGSLFYVLLDHPCTALFLWLLIIALILAIFINGRRRRRAETENRKETNSSISYIRHLATIYTKDTDYSELLRIEKRVLLYKLRKEYYFDMRTRDYTEASQFAEHIANSKHLDKESVKEVLTTLEELTANGVQVDDKAYRVCLEQLDKIK